MATPCSSSQRHSASLCLTPFLNSGQVYTFFINNAIPPSLFFLSVLPEEIIPIYISIHGLWFVPSPCNANFVTVLIVMFIPHPSGISIWIFWGFGSFRPHHFSFCLCDLVISHSLPLPIFDQVTCLVYLQGFGFFPPSYFKPSLMSSSSA